MIENLKIELKDLDISKKKSDDISNNLNKKLSDTHTKFKKEKDNMVKEHKAEVKSWRNDLGDERKLKVKLEKELNVLKSSSVSDETRPLNPSEPNPKAALGVKALPTPFFSFQTQPVQTVCTSTRTLPQPLTTQAPPPALSCSPCTPTGTPPLRVPKQTQIDDIRDEIVDISADDIDNVEEFIDRELLEELDALNRKAYEEDTYSDVDVENLPDYYWEMEYETED